jgi:ubiquinone/menaquinone biosynthesis C-methylase UbiE
VSEAFLEGHYVAGVLGLALLRAGAERRFGSVPERVRELRDVVERLDEDPYAARRDLSDEGVAGGYEQWSRSYDDPGNDTVELEEPSVRRLLDALPPGPVLDAACGTGRHAEYLLATGREVIGVDASEAMLERARGKLPGVELRHGELTALPVADESVDGAVCALALSHLPELGPAIRELRRVLRRGGRLVTSDPHPFATGVLGWRAVFVDAAGERRTIREHPHLHAEYVSAFTAAGLVVRQCVEPTISPGDARARAKGSHADAFEQALTGLPGVIVWEVERE